MLTKAGVVSVSGGTVYASDAGNQATDVPRSPDVTLTPAFKAALKYRDLLQTKLQFSELVAPDFFARLPQLLSSFEDFISTSKLFERRVMPVPQAFRQDSLRVQQRENAARCW